MRRIEARMSIGLVGCKLTTAFHVSDDTPDEEIDEMVFQWAMEEVDSGWSEASGDGEGA